MTRQGLRLAYAAAVLNAVIIGFSFLFAKIALAYTHPLDTMTYRFIVSFGALLLWLQVQRGGRKLNMRAVMRIIPLALLYPIGFFTLQAYGLQYATSAEGGMLHAFTPVLTMGFAALLLKEQITPLQTASIVLSACGVSIIVMSQDRGVELSGLLGILLLLASCLAFAGYSVMAKSLLSHMTPINITFWMQGIGVVCFVSASFSMHMTNGTFYKLIEPLSSLPFVASILFLGLLSSLVTALTANYALSKLEASRAAVFMNLSPIVSIAAGALFLGESITIWQLVGAALILIGVVGANRPRPNKAERQLHAAE